MRSLALGLGMHPDVIDALSTQELRDVLNARRAWEEHYHLRPVYEAARISGWMSLNPYMKKGSQDGPADIYPLRWDLAPKEAVKEDAKPISVEEAEAMFARFDRLPKT